MSRGTFPKRVTYICHLKTPMLRCMTFCLKSEGEKRTRRGIFQSQRGRTRLALLFNVALAPSIFPKSLTLRLVPLHIPPKVYHFRNDTHKGLANRYRMLPLRTGRVGMREVYHSYLQIPQLRGASARRDFLSAVWIFKKSCPALRPHTSPSLGKCASGNSSSLSTAPYSLLLPTR